MCAHVTVLDGAALRSRGLTRVEEALRGVSGLSVARNGSMGGVASLFTRGGESDHTLVLLDGVQLNQPGGAFDLSSLSLTNVERIEIVRGPSSALYGSRAVAGVVNVITRVGRGAAEWEAVGQLGSYAHVGWSGGVSGGSDALGYSLAVSGERTDGVLPINNDHDHTVLSGAVRVRPDTDHAGRPFAARR